jgi:hypothetical protein
MAATVSDALVFSVLRAISLINRFFPHCRRW